MTSKRGPSTFKQQDVTRAVKAMRAADIEVARVEIDKSGKISIFTGKCSKPDESNDAANPWDTIL